MKEQELTLVGLTPDQSHLVMVSVSGEEFTLPADSRLRAALRGDRAHIARLGQLEITMDSALRPRDIQARIRAGESPESVAAAAQTTLDRVMAYATPVLAERAHIAGRALTASVRRRAGESPSRTLGDAVAERLRSRHIDPETVEWDSWRRDDGRWAVVADYRSGERARHAEFVFDAPGRYVVAEDDDARWLVGEATPSRGPQPRSGVQGGRRLSAVRGEEDELPLGDDAIDLVTDRSSEEETVDLTAAADTARRSDAATPAVPPGDADWIAAQAPATDAPAEHAPGPEGTEQAGDSETTDEVAAGDADPADRKGNRKPRRPSVPSWDEIMFGGGKRE